MATTRSVVVTLQAAAAVVCARRAEAAPARTTIPAANARQQRRMRSRLSEGFDDTDIDGGAAFAPGIVGAEIDVVAFGDREPQAGATTRQRVVPVEAAEIRHHFAAAAEDRGSKAPPHLGTPLRLRGEHRAIAVLPDRVSAEILTLAQ